VALAIALIEFYRVIVVDPFHAAGQGRSPVTGPFWTDRGGNLSREAARHVK
jgi:hypothetical protein